jgi:multisubunit Na+/H+ antiporter MnhC subunit
MSRRSLLCLTAKIAAILVVQKTKKRKNKKNIRIQNLRLWKRQVKRGTNLKRKVKNQDPPPPLPHLLLLTALAISFK